MAAHRPEPQIDNQLVVTPYPALLYPIVEALPPRHAAVRRHHTTSASAPAAGGVGGGVGGTVAFASFFDMGATGSAGFAGRGREEDGGGEQDGGQVSRVAVPTR